MRKMSAGVATRNDENKQNSRYFWVGNPKQNKNVSSHKSSMERDSIKKSEKN